MLTVKGGNRNGINVNGGDFLNSNKVILTNFKLFLTFYDLFTILTLTTTTTTNLNLNK